LETLINQHKPDLFRVSYAEIENYGIKGDNTNFLLGLSNKMGTIQENLPEISHEPEHNN
jgi:hypothetical protein